ncbi:MAG: clan AA aspartic protease [Bacteroidetes bacterium]|nr:MAG: clan AA aspartic protease [Bacteroidota bacterium]
MGLTYAKIKLSNPRNPNLKDVEVDSLVDTGAMWTCIPDHIAIQLELEELEKREITAADGKKHACPYVGPIRIKFENRNCFSGAIILGDTVLLGAVQMEDMDVIVHPFNKKLMVNPENPNMPAGIAKGLKK